MAQKLIKINTDHYVVVDDSEIINGDWYYDSNDVESLIPIYQKSQQFADYSGCKKITHSTQPLEHGTEPFADGVQYVKIYNKIKPLSLQEVKELIGEVDVMTKAVRDIEGTSWDEDAKPSFLSGYLRGYRQALEDNKEKKYTEEDVISIVKKSRETGLTAEYLMLTLQPKTEWEVCFVNGKLKLKL